MIYTLTFNPAIDYIVHIDEIDVGHTNRTHDECFFCGGKGINVSTILSRLGIQTTALGFCAGFTGDYLLDIIENRGIKSDFIKLNSGYTRINIKIKSKQETELNAQGPNITDADFEQLMQKLDKLTSEDILVISGSIPSCLSKNTYENILEELDNKHIRTIVDTTDELLLNVLKYHPFLIKPNIDELGDIFGKRLTDEQDIIHYAKELQNMGAVNVLVSMGGDGALLVSEHGEAYRCPSAKGKVKNSVGAGDSMVAGFITGYLKSNDYKTALKLGIACGSATAFSYDLATKDEIMAVYDSLGDI